MGDLGGASSAKAERHLSHICFGMEFFMSHLVSTAQNGVAKRKNSHVLEVACALLFQMTVPKPFWADAVSTACFLINRMPSAVLGHSKLDPKSLKCVFLGYSRIQKGYRCYSPQLHRRPRITSDLVREPSTQLKDAPIDAPNDDAPNDAPNDVSNDAPNDVSNDVPISAPSEACGKSDAPSDAPSGSDSPPPSRTPELDVPIALRKGKRTCRYPVSAFVSYDVLSTSFRAFVANLDSILVPNTVGEALAHSGWRAAMIEEMNALDHNCTWALVDLHVYKKAIGCRWVFSVKMNPDGSIARLKARLVAKGYAQTYGIDYSETFSPNAFLHGDLEEVYMEQPPRFVAHGEFGRVDAVTQILGYMKGTPGLGILYANHGHHIAESFTDADDYAGCPNTSLSTTGYCVFVGGNLVSWKSKKQNIVSRSSSSEAEYRAMTQTTCELVWLRNLLGEIGFPQSKPMKMWCDNQAAIYVATNPVFHKRTKHIEVDCHFTREKLEDGTITTPHIRTESQLADVLTKAFPGTRINSICNKLGMINIYAQLEGNVKICIRVGPTQLEGNVKLSLVSKLHDGEVWTFSVRAYDSPRPERAITVNYDGFAEGVDFIAVSFVKSAEVINHLKSYIKARSRDGQLNKPVIVASQLLESMIEYPTPTRAEVADVSEAVRQRADALMLSGESAMDLPDIASSFSDSISEEICNSAAKMANNLEVDALFVYTKDGHMASLLSRSRPDCPIFAFTTDTSVRRRLNLQWGLIPFRLGFSDDMESNLNKTFALLKARATKACGAPS
nr:uncharacterized mitochondrial protein AtMg00810-like [Tanacetum cinerariifolium]